MVEITFSQSIGSVLTLEKRAQLKQIHEDLYSKKGKGSDFLGWLDWPSTLDSAFMEKVEKTATQIRDKADVLVVIGIGGSYLGAKAVLSALDPYFKKEAGLEVVFAGHQVSGEYLKQLLAHLDGKRVMVNVISKSGKTTEPALAFRFLKDYMEKRYGQEAAERIIVTTDAEKGALLTLAEENGYERFVVPEDVGGRYSVFTAVGLVPIAAAGYSIKDLLAGAADAEKVYNNMNFDENVAIQYAAIRHQLYVEGYTTEVMAIFEPKLSFVQEWWKQLFGESEGKEGKGIFPASVSFTTDLHSMGQYIQDGKRNLFETFLLVQEANEDLTVFEAENDGDELNYLAGLSLQEFNHVAHKGTSSAHLDGGVPQLSLTIPKIDEFQLGHLLYFYMLSCAYSAYMLDINPFDQPGVEDYKNNVFKLLNKPGF
ncbi:MAG: glucose-6-phosphate isomerase [Planococcus sp. (in: firmicutes)]|uniref:glucose-6-phosphate isomerase n=1 Tax=Planococcus halocryophilus TaxID=1215089 RepID=UPI001F0DB156|nr:glucose-6-phosphate isomerase [Planococcus halocryophilus]MCH4826197.1 glucose-6-phosphate isomerase [Planococcus halocryophilus]